MLNKSTSSAPHGKTRRQQIQHYNIQRAQFKAFLDELETIQANQDRVEITDFFLEYKHIYNALLATYENERRLVKKKKELEENIIKLSKEINSNIQAGEREEQHISIMIVETKREKGKLSELQEELKNFKLEILQLNKDIAYVQKQHENEYKLEQRKLIDKLNNIKIIKSEVENKKLHAGSEVEKLKSVDTLELKKLKNIQTKNMKVLKEISTFTTRMNDIQQSVDEKTDEIERNKNLLDMKKVEVAELSKKVSDANTDHKRVMQEIEKGKDREIKIKALCKQKEQELKKAQETEAEEKVRRDKFVSNNAKLETEKVQILSSTDETEKHVQRVIIENNKMNIRKHLLCSLHKKLQKTQEKTNSEKNDMLIELDRMDRENARIRKEKERKKATIEELKQQQRILDGNNKNERQIELEKNDILAVLANRKRNLLQNNHVYQKEGENDRKTMFMLEEQLKNFRRKELELSENCSSIQLKKNILNLTKKELEERIENEKMKLSKQHELYEEVEYDRNEFSKKLSKIEMLSHVQKKKFFILLTTIKHVKSEIKKRNDTARERAFEILKVKEDIKRLDKLMFNLEERISSVKSKIKEKDGNIQELNSVLSETQENKAKQKREVEVLTNERDILGNNLLERNEQIVNIYNEMKLNQEKINNGKLEYEKKLEKIELLQSRNNSLARKIAEISELLDIESKARQEINSLRRELITEKMKLTVLLDETGVKLNIHRFRKLKNSNPKLYKKYKAIQKLEKQLYDESAKLHKIDNLIKEKEMLYKQLRVLLENRQNTEVNLQNEILEKNLKKKKRQLVETRKKLAETKLMEMHKRNEMMKLQKEYTKLNQKFKKQFFRENSM